MYLTQKEVFNFYEVYIIKSLILYRMNYDIIFRRLFSPKTKKSPTIIKALLLHSRKWLENGVLVKLNLPFN